MFNPPPSLQFNAHPGAVCVNDGAGSVSKTSEGRIVQFQMTNPSVEPQGRRFLPTHTQVSKHVHPNHRSSRAMLNALVSWQPHVIFLNLSGFPVCVMARPLESIFRDRPPCFNVDRKADRRNRCVCSSGCSSRFLRVRGDLALVCASVQSMLRWLSCVTTRLRRLLGPFSCCLSCLARSLGPCWLFVACDWASVPP